MNSITGQLYPSVEDALADLPPDGKPEDIVEIHSTREAVEEISRSIQQVRAIEKRREQNKAARKARRANR